MAATPARIPNTNPSSNELLASLLAPCTPLQANLARKETRQCRGPVDVGRNPPPSYNEHSENRDHSSVISMLMT